MGELEAMAAAPRQHELEITESALAGRQVRDQPRGSLERHREEQQPARPAAAPVGDRERQREGTPGEELARILDRDDELLQIHPRHHPRDHQHGEHAGQHQVERVVAGVGRRRRHHHGEQDEPEADLRDADPFGDAAASARRDQPAPAPAGRGRSDGGACERSQGGAQIGSGVPWTRTSTARRAASSPLAPRRNTTRWASTAGANRWTSSGTAKSRPSKSASACAAR